MNKKKRDELDELKREIKIIHLGNVKSQRHSKGIKRLQWQFNFSLVIIWGMLEPLRGTNINKSRLLSVFLKLKILKI